MVRYQENIAMGRKRKAVAEAKLKQKADMVAAKAQAQAKKMEKGGKKSAKSVSQE